MNTIENLEFKIAKFLRAGVILAGVLMFAGWMATINLRSDSFFNFTIYDEIPLKDLLKHHMALANYGVLISYVGLLTLISLPVIRVFLTTYLFIRQKEYVLALIAFIVLLGLIVSMSLGIDL